MANLINKVEDSNRKPILELIPLERTAVHTPTKKTYNELMRIYEVGKWRFAGNTLPTTWDVWFLREEKTCITAGNVTPVFKKVDYSYCFKDYYLGKNYKIISPQEFYDKQKITPEIIKEINKYFGEIK